MAGQSLRTQATPNPSLDLTSPPSVQFGVALRGVAWRCAPDKGRTIRALGDLSIGFVH